MSEEIVEEIGTTEAAPVADDSTYSKILAGEEAAPLKTDSSVKAESENNPEPEKDLQKDESLDQEIVLEIGGKSFTMKESEAIQLLENASKTVEREKALQKEWDSKNRDYTQKTQAVAEFRKSVETTFGRFPDKSEIQALGKLWKGYFSNPQVKQTVDAILQGRVDGLPKSANAQQPGQEANAYVTQLQSEISELREKLGEFTTTFEERETAKSYSEAKASWDGWVVKQAEAKVSITEELEAVMTPFISAISKAHPDWDNHKILDAAYKHATIDDIKKTAQTEVLKSVDQAKKQPKIRITPKTPVKAESEKTYKDIFLEV